MDDHTLENAFIENHYDEKTIAFCKRKNILSFADLKEFLLKEKPAYGNKSSDRKGYIFDLYSFALKTAVLPENYKDMKIGEILDAENASVRSRNVCEIANIRNLFDFLKYLKVKKTFIKLKNCGTTSNEELTLIALKYLNYGNPSIVQEEPACLEPVKEFTELDFVEIASLDRTILHSLNSYLLKRLHSLSQRTKNVLNKYLDFPLNYYSYHEKIINNMDTFKKKKNIGESSVEEVELINEELRYLYKNLCNEDISRIQADFLQFEFLCKRFYGIKYVDQSILDDFVNHNFKLFRFFDYIISKVLPENHILILKNYSKFNFYKSCENFTMESIGKLCGVTRQRIYQLTYEVEDKIRINLINFSYFFKYSYLRELKDRNIVVINEDLSNQINRSESVGFTVDFYAYALDKILGSRFILYNKDNRVSRSSGFIVRSEAAKIFKTEKFLAEIENRLGEMIRVSYNLELNEILKKYISVLSDEHYKAVREICSTIISECYSGMKIEGDFAVFQSNSKPKREDIIIGIIEKSGKPMTTDELFEEYKIAAPESTMSALRGILNNSKKIKYIRGGYGEGKLTYYATEKIILKQEISEGTAREIAYEYLEEQKQPCHIDDIFEYVKEKRPHLIKDNLDTNLRLDNLNVELMPFGYFCLKKYYSAFELQKTYPKQLQIYGKAYIHKTNCSYSDLLSYLCNRYDLEFKFIKLLFDRLIKNGTILSTNGIYENGILSLSEETIEQMMNMKRKFI